MSTYTSTSTSTGTTGRHHGELSRPASIATSGAQGLLGLAIAGGGMLKLTADPLMVDLFHDIGAGQWFRVLVGVLEVLGGVGLLVPRVRALAALGLFLLLVGAAFTNVAVLHISPASALGFAAVALTILIVRRRELPGR